MRKMFLVAAAAPAGNPALKSLDKMIQEADITPTNLKNWVKALEIRHHCKCLLRMWAT